MAKKSIREFVSEDDLKFQLYYMKYSRQLKLVKENYEEFKNNWISSHEKKILKLKNDLNKTKNEIEINSLKHNISYLENMFSNVPKEEDLKNSFNIKLDEYISVLESKFKENPTTKNKEDLNYALSIKEEGLTTNPSKEKFGVLLLLIINNLVKMPSFSGYTENWKTDFYSNAVEKTLLYLENFDDNILSKRTGKKSKAFAYVTQICFNAFLNVINTRKKETEGIDKVISLESYMTEGVKNVEELTYEYEYKKEEKTPFIIEFKNVENFKKEIDEILKNNSEYEKKELLQTELEDIELENITEKDPEYKDYIEYKKNIEQKINEINVEYIDFLYIRISNLNDINQINSIMQDKGFDYVISQNKYQKDKTINKEEKDLFYEEWFE